LKKVARFDQYSKSLKFDSSLRQNHLEREIKKQEAEEEEEEDDDEEEISCAQVNLRLHCVSVLESHHRKENLEIGEIEDKRW